MWHDQSMCDPLRCTRIASSFVAWMLVAQGTGCPEEPPPIASDATGRTSNTTIHQNDIIASQGQSAEGGTVTTSDSGVTTAMSTISTSHAATDRGSTTVRVTAMESSTGAAPVEDTDTSSESAGSRGSDSSVGSQTSGGPKCAPVPHNPIAWWTFDDDFDTSQGTTIGTPTLGEGIVGQALILEGHDAIEFPVHDGFYPTGSFSIEGWISAGPTGERQTILSLYECAFTCTNSRGLYIFHLTMNTGQPSIELRVSDLAEGVDESRTHGHTGDSEANDEQFHHVAVVRDSERDELRVYFDGEQDRPPEPLNASSRGPISDFDEEVDTIVIGARYTHYQETAMAQFFRGTIDELSYYDGALDDDDVASIFAAGTKGKCR